MYVLNESTLQGKLFGIEHNLIKVKKKIDYDDHSAYMGICWSRDSNYYNEAPKI